MKTTAVVESLSYYKTNVLFQTIQFQLASRFIQQYEKSTSKNDSTPFLPLKSMTGGKVTYMQNKEDICLTERQADHVYKAMERVI